MSDLLALAERCEAATGPSLILERDIALAIYPDAKPIPGNESRISVWDGNGRTQLTVKAYTASLDAAMTLVPSGWVFLLETWREIAASARVCEWNVGDQGPEGNARTPALALCAAALRARHASSLTLTPNEGEGA